MDQVFIEKYGHLIMLGLFIFIIIVGVFLAKFRVFRMIFKALWRVFLFSLFLVFCGVLSILFSYLAHVMIFFTEVFGDNLILFDANINKSDVNSLAAITFGILSVILLMLSSFIYSLIPLKTKQYTALVFGTTFLSLFIIYPIGLTFYAPGITFSFLALLLMNLIHLPFFIVLFSKFVRGILSSSGNRYKYNRDLTWREQRREYRRWENEQKRKEEDGRRMVILLEAVFPWIYKRKAI